MFRISLLVIGMILISHAPDNMGSLISYKDYLIALMLTLLVKPWVTNQYQ